MDKEIENEFLKIEKKIKRLSMNSEILLRRARNIYKIGQIKESLHAINKLV